MRNSLLFLCLLLIVIAGCEKKEDPVRYLAGDEAAVPLIKDEEKTALPRGTAVYLDKISDETATVYTLDEENEKTVYTVDYTRLKENIDEVVTNESVTVNMLLNLRKDRGDDISDITAAKGEKLKVTGVNAARDLNADGTVDGYRVEKDGETCWVDTFYTTAETFDKTVLTTSDYFDRRYGEGYSRKTYIDDVTYLNCPKPDFADNPLRKDIRAVHTGLTVAIDQKDYLISLIKDSGLNALVMEIKSDDGRLMFQSDTAKTVLKDTKAAFQNSLSKADFQALIDSYHEQGIYVIGRMAAFKDPVLAKNIPDIAIKDAAGKLLTHDGLYWPSPYSRVAWRYNAGIAREAAELGVNEIQFDYVRFPDGMDDEGIDYVNQYQESKVQAITGFLYYARDELHALDTYLSADVFGWNMICGDDQDIGQFVPAMATVVDFISPMAYPDHFSAGQLGLALPWQEPGRLQKEFTAKSMTILNQLQSPAIYRTWIQGYSCLDWVCDGTAGNPARDYGPDDMASQISGIKEAGQQGYMVWSGNGGQEMFDWRKSGFIE